jgi:hypothetical protein
MDKLSPRLTHDHVGLERPSSRGSFELRCFTS